MKTHSSISWLCSIALGLTGTLLPTSLAAQVPIVPISKTGKSAVKKEEADKLPPIIPLPKQEENRGSGSSFPAEISKQAKMAPPISSADSQGSTLAGRSPSMQKKPSCPLPQIKKWDPASLVDLPPVKSWTPNSQRDDQTVKAASFANPKRPLPTTTRPLKNDPGSSKKIVLPIRRSPKKQTEKVIVSRTPETIVTPWKTSPTTRPTVTPSPIPQEPATSSSRLPRAGAVTPQPSKVVKADPSLPVKELKSQIEALLPAKKTAGSKNRTKEKEVSVANPYNPKNQSLLRLGKKAGTPGKVATIQLVANPKPIMPSTPISANGATAIGGDCNLGPISLPHSPRAALRAEALCMTREGGSVTVSDEFGMDPFQYDLGIRINAQRLFGVDGPNITYSGFQEWNDTRRIASPTGGLGIGLTGAGLPAGTLAPFTNAIFQQQYHRANMHTLEVNKVTWAWDVINLFWGFRFTRYEEEFSFFSARADGQTGLLDLDYENNMFGPQVGGEFFYDIGRRFSSGFKGKVGVMANSFKGHTQVWSNGTRRINNGDTDVAMNLLAEAGFFGRMKLGQRAFLRGGYEIWYNTAVYGVNDNIPAIITPGYGNVSFDNDLFIHGATIGLEFIW